MPIFLINILLAILWSFFNGDLSLTVFLTGFVLGYFALWLNRALFSGHRRYFIIPNIVILCLLFIKDILFSAQMIGKEILTLKKRRNPGIIEYKTQYTITDLEYLLINIFVTANPGTFIISYDTSRGIMYIHVMFMDQRENIISFIRDVIEYRVLSMTRGDQ